MVVGLRQGKAFEAASNLILQTEKSDLFKSFFISGLWPKWSCPNKKWFQLGT
jgi:hypothetical protein